MYTDQVGNKFPSSNCRKNSSCSYSIIKFILHSSRWSIKFFYLNVKIVKLQSSIIFYSTLSTILLEVLSSGTKNEFYTVNLLYVHMKSVKIFSSRGVQYVATKWNCTLKLLQLNYVGVRNKYHKNKYFDIIATINFEF